VGQLARTARADSSAGSDDPMLSALRSGFRSVQHRSCVPPVAAVY